MPKKQDAVAIPKHVMHEVIEHTPGGFILFYFNPKDGCPEYQMTFDNPAYYLGMCKYVTDWSKAMNTIQTLVASNDINQVIGNDDESGT